MSRIMMPPHKIGVAREWRQRGLYEKRVPLVPEHLKILSKEGIDIVVQACRQRGFAREEFIDLGIPVVSGLADCSIIISRGTLSPLSIKPGKTYLYFSHDIKGQPYFPPTYKELRSKECQLIDYKRIVDERGKRLVKFGDFVGSIAMLEALWALRQRLDFEGVVNNPFSSLVRANQYGGIGPAQDSVRRLGQRVRSEGLPESLSPFVCGFAGTGNDGIGAIRLFDQMDPVELKAADLMGEIRYGDFSRYNSYKIVFGRGDRVESLDSDREFSKGDFNLHPENYTSAMEGYLPHLTVFMNAIYWDERFPRLITNPMLRRVFAQGSTTRLRVIGDITDAINGSVDCTVLATNAESPVYSYDPFTRETPMGVEGTGVVVMANDAYPSLMPREASEIFSRGLYPLIPALARVDFSKELEEANLSPELKRGVILWQGKEVGDLSYI